MSERDDYTVASGGKETDGPDETTALMVYGNLRIVDVQTGEILVNKRA